MPEGAGTSSLPPHPRNQSHEVVAGTLDHKRKTGVPATKGGTALDNKKTLEGTHSKTHSRAKGQNGPGGGEVWVPWRDPLHHPL